MGAPGARGTGCGAPRGGAVDALGHGGVGGLGWKQGPEVLGDVSIERWRALEEMGVSDRAMWVTNSRTLVLLLGPLAASIPPSHVPRIEA